MTLTFGRSKFSLQRQTWLFDFIISLTLGHVKNISTTCPTNFQRVVHINIEINFIPSEKVAMSLERDVWPRYFKKCPLPVFNKSRVQHWTIFCVVSSHNIGWVNVRRFLWHKESWFYVIICKDNTRWIHLGCKEEKSFSSRVSNVASAWPQWIFRILTRRYVCK